MYYVCMNMCSMYYVCMFVNELSILQYMNVLYTYVHPFLIGQQLS